MPRYLNRSGDSAVVSYEIVDDGISVVFRDGWGYLYTHASTGSAQVEAMVDLARAGMGLNSYINRFVRKNYSKKFWVDLR